MLTKIDKKINLKNIIIYLIFSANFLILFAYLPFYQEFQLFKGADNNYQLLRFDNIYFPRLKILTYSAFILLILFLIYIIKNQDNIKNNVFNYLIFSLFILFSFSTYFAVDPFTALNGRIYRWEGFIALAAYLFFSFLTANLVRKLNYFKIYAYLIWGSAAVLSVYGLLQYFGFDFIKRDPLRENWYRAFATFGNPNFAASFSVLVLPTFILLYLVLKKSSYKSAAFAGSSLVYAFLLSTATRGAWLGFFLTVTAAVILLFDYLKQKKKEILKLLLIFILITIFLNSFHGGLTGLRFISIFHDLQDLSSAEEEEIDRVGSNRIFIYKNSLPLLLENPILGAGPDNFAEVFPQQKYREFAGSKNQIVDKAHSEYLQLGVTAGIPALIIYLALIAYILYQLRPKAVQKIELEQKEGLKEFIKLTLFFSILAYALQAVLNISVVTVAPVFWTILGFAGAYIINFKDD
ncbi:O-antigen ligase family protein [Halanaerobium saccharolyticum]|uniref:Putative inorganic carbon (HCO3(-)) transporter n=1 Tax=Halanaerobium saccharolyticum TaxID=43595 RepID=A0A2T5RK21_9FIRM|nr:O-antigen ligase family protein [Halanaerobium saccharolyticum]PTV99121.1 putative inorganic carbon (HCO3(-)) transporter [Halanaerobium saccharolyticum]